jgi:sugar lactone lactonase YvrE
MRMTTITKISLTLLLAALTTPITVHAFDRGKVERFATLPAGTGHPEGICTGSEGNVYVATVDVPTPDRKNGTLIVFDANGKYLRTIRVANSSTMLLDIRFHPQTGKLIVVDYGAAKLLTVDPKTGDSSVFMTVTGDHPGLDAFCFDTDGNVYTTDAHQGIIWKVGKDGGAAEIFVQDPLLKPNRPPPEIGANGVWLNNEQTTMFVANTAQDTIIKIPLNGSPLKPGTPEVFVNRAGGGPDGILIDEHDNIWIACNQSDEVMVVEPKQGRVIAKLGDFGGVDKDGAPIGLLWSNTLCFRSDDVLVTNLSLDVAAVTSPSLRTVDGPWAAQVKLHTVSKIKKQIPGAVK